MNKLRDDINGLVKCSLQTLRKRKKQGVSLRTVQSSSLLFPNYNNFFVWIDLRNALFLFVDNKHLHGFLGEICLPARLQPKVSSPTQSHPCRPHPKVTNEIKNKHQSKHGHTLMLFVWSAASRRTLFPDVSTLAQWPSHYDSSQH